MEALLSTQIIAPLGFIEWYHWVLVAIVIILIVIKKMKSE